MLTDSSNFLVKMGAVCNSFNADSNSKEKLQDGYYKVCYHDITHPENMVFYVDGDQMKLKRKETDEWYPSMKVIYGKVLINPPKMCFLSFI